MMDVLLDFARWLDAGRGGLPVLLDAVIKATLLLGLAALASLALRRASAASRHAIWTTAVVGSLALPLLLVGLPQWRVPVLPAVASVPAPDVATSRQPVTGVGHSPEGVLREAGPVNVPVAHGTPAVAPRSSVSSGVSASTVLLGTWATVVVVLLLRLALGHWRVRRLARTPADGVAWLEEARQLVDDAGMTPRPAFVEGPANAMPMTWGILRQVVMLPAAHVAWPAARRRVVLLHELAHVARRDCLTQTLAHLGCAFYWFNPLSWLAASRLAAERERACDDWVMAAGTDGPEYAEQLLDMARAMRPVGLSWSGVAMARRSQLEGRLIAILDREVSRRPLTRVAAVAITSAIVLAVPILAAVRPAPAPVPGEHGAAAWDGGARRSLTALVPPGWVSANADEDTETPAPADVDATGGPQTPTPMPAPAPAPVPRPAAAPQAAPVVKVVVDPVVISTGVTEGMADAIADGIVQGVGEGRGTGRSTGRSEERRAPADPQVIDALTLALKDSDEEVREQALFALGRLRDRRATGAVAAMLSDSSPALREHAAMALGSLRDPAAVEPLVAALRDDVPAVREHAAFALGQLRDPRAVEPLIALVGDENADVREQACFALAQARDKRATPKLIQALEDSDVDVRQQAAFALGQVRDPAAAPALAGRLKDADADVRQQSVFALGQLRDPQAVEPLIQALGDPDPDVQEQAAFALGQLRDRRATQPLVRALQSGPDGVREHAAWALGHVGDPAAADALLAAIKDANAQVRKAAALAFSQLADK